MRATALPAAGRAEVTTTRIVHLEGRRGEAPCGVPVIGVRGRGVANCIVCLGLRGERRRRRYADGASRRRPSSRSRP